jgi:hypothetical protein
LYVAPIVAGRSGSGESSLLCTLSEAPGLEHHYRPQYWLE